jgi:hypothetical protein
MGLRGTSRLLAALVLFGILLLAVVSLIVLGTQPA